MPVAFQESTQNGFEARSILSLYLAPRAIQVFGHFKAFSRKKAANSSGANA
jgi:hypothetical protein